MLIKRGLYGALIGMLLVFAASAMAGDKPTFDIDWYGYVKLDASYDQNPTSHGNFAMWVKESVINDDDAQFNMTHKSTRLGFKASGKNFEQVTVGGKLEFDMYGAGGTENKALLLLRHAYFTVQSGNFKLLAGQSWDLISPLNPSTLNYPVLWGAGNIQYRRPQVSMFYTVAKTEQTNANLAAGLFRTIGNDLTPTFSLALGETADGTDDGTDAAIPSFQGRLDVTHKLTSGGSIRGGFSGLYGQLKSESTLGNSEKYESWVACGHFMLSFPSGAGFSGEVWSGSNLGSYFGSILNTNRIDGLASNGGWVSAWVKPSKKVKFTTGFSFDDPDDADLSTGNRSRNQAIFGNIKYSIVPAVTFGVELTQWETEYKDSESAKALRVETSFIMNF
ncbi:MAG: hypothetical protein KOO62_02165 [candidate division Zixibacteria bacterium]|nr:hypothetical protein [candidate division Zixibacteria bacterium]